MPPKSEEAKRLYYKEYAQEHKKHRAELAHANYLAKRESKLAQIKAWYDRQSPNYSAEKSRRWRMNNPEKFRAQVEKYRVRHNQLQNEQKRQLRETNGDLVRIMDKVYRYRRRALGSINAEDIKYIIERDNWHCGICNRRVSRSQFSIDHILPISQGGKNGRANLRLAHFSCNARRRDKGIAQLRLMS